MSVQLKAVPSGTIYLNTYVLMNFQQTILGVNEKHSCLHSTEGDTLAH